ncbi:MAG: tetratricopeptide repeat protein [Acidobacteriota bacterium]
MTAETHPALAPRALRLALAALMLLIATASAAQDWKGRGRVTGSVTGADGTPIKGATVKLSYRGEEGNGPTNIKTNKKGEWAYMGLTSGSFTVVVEADGFVPAQGEIRINEYQPLAQKPMDVALNPVGETADAKGDRLMGMVAEGNELLSGGDPVAARAKFEEVMVAIEEEGGANNEAQKTQLEGIIALTYLEEGQAAEARSRLEALLPTTAENPAARIQMLQNIARSYYLEDNIDASVATLEKALAVDPANVDSLRRIVDTLLAAGREADAEPYMERLPAGEKIDPNALLNLGITAYNGGDMDTALEKFEKVVESYPDNALAFYYLGLSQMGKGQTDLAKTSLERMLALEPEHPNAAEAKEFLSYLGGS